MRCLYCDKPIEKYTFKSLFLKEDGLCPSCRSGLKVKRRIIDVGEFKVECFFEYDGMYRSLLLQFKECHDEALKDVFLYDLKEYLEIRYFGYEVLFVPSGERKRKERGFDHLQEMFSQLRLKRACGLRMKEDLCQEGMSLAQRKRMYGNYVYEGDRIDKVLIADDVMSSGSSLAGAFHAIRPFAGNVKVLSLAYKSITLHY